MAHDDEVSWRTVTAVAGRLIPAGIALALAAVLVSCGDGGEGRPSVDPTRSVTASPSPTASLPSPTRTPIRSDPTAETESPEPSRSPERSERPTATTSPPATEVETPSEAPPESTVAASPTDPVENTDSDSDEDSADVPAWVWWLLAALALALVVGIPVLVRSRRSKAWASDLEGAEQEMAWLVRELLPGLQRSGSREQAVGGWAVSSERVRALEDRLTGLEATAPGESGRERARTLRDAVRVARARVDGLSASATDQSASAELGSVAQHLSSALWPPVASPT